ncbi:MAG: Ig-like domain-containing protein [Planctomycetota bacterium]|nr:Ig-like domain-containing protein [Planctomycetota bacterium]
MNKLLRTFFVAALIAGSPSNLIFALTSTDYYVDISAVAGGDGSAATPWTTITEALDSGLLVAGDTVNIATGIYDTENFPLDLVTGVTYIGAGPATEVSFPSTLVGVGSVFEVTPVPGVSATTISNISVDLESGDAVNLSGVSATTAFQLDQVTFNGHGQGDLLDFNTQNVVSNLSITNCDVSSANILELEMDFSSMSSASNTIEVNGNNVSNGDFDVIDIYRVNGASVNIEISGNVMNTVGDNAIVCDIENAPVANVTISNNTFDLVDDEVISADFQGIDAASINISNNTLTNGQGNGMVIFMSSDSSSSATTQATVVVNINDNNIDAQEGMSINLGVHSTSAALDYDVSINSNTITNGSDTGILCFALLDSCTDGDITFDINNNSISGCQKGVIFAAGASSATGEISYLMRDNTITSNDGTGISLMGGASSANLVLDFDLGTLADGGNNTIHSNGGNPSVNVGNSSSSYEIYVSNGSEFSSIEIPAYGNDWNTSDLAVIEDSIYHKVDDPVLMEVLFDAGAPLPPGPPVAVYDTRTPADCGPLVIDVADNDLDVNNNLDLESVVITQNPGHGIVIVLGGGLVEYTADYAWVGADTFNYHISDLTGLVSNIATVQVDSPGNNELPEANYDAYTMSEADAPQTYDIAANDTVPSGRPLDLASVAITQNPAKGNVINNFDGTVTYAFTGDLSGALSTTDTFNYTIRDDCGVLSNVATVEVEITRVVGTPPDSGSGFSLAVSQMSVGQSASLNFAGATPNVTVKIYASRIHQVSNTNFGVSELGNPRVNLGAAQSNMFGSGSISFNVPASLHGQTIWFQALDTNENALSAAVSADVN